MIQTSEPIVITFENTDNLLSQDIVAFNSFAATRKRVNGTFLPNFGMSVKITVPSLGGGIPYGVFLQSLKSQPFKFNKIYIQSSNQSQITKALTLVQADSFGNATADLVFPKLDPMQNQSEVLMFNHEMVLNGYSQVRFSILPLTTVTMSFYPSDQINQANQLIGQSIIDQYRFKSISQLDV